MARGIRSIRVVLLALLLAGCAAAPTPPPTPTPSDTGSLSTTLPVLPTATGSPSPLPPSPSVVPTPAPSPTTQAPALPAGTGGFTTPRPPDPAKAWTGIRWRKVAAKDPLAHVRSVTRWPGGFVATGDLIVNDGKARNKVWASTDGRTWQLLGEGTFGPTAVVVGVAPTADGVVALTLQSGRFESDTEDGGSISDPEQLILAGPWQTWTSADGRTWIAHPGPAFTVPRSMTGADDGHPTLLAGAGDDVVALTLEGQPLAFSRDGATWETASLDAFPGGAAGWSAVDIAAFPPGFVSVGSSPDGAVAIASADGRTWTTSKFPAACSPGQLTVGPAGLIAAFDEGDPHTPQTIWCSSLDGRAWRRLPGIPPLGYAKGASAQECRGTCPNGILLGDGERMLAYRNHVHAKQAGWTSFDGRTWRRLAFTGRRPKPWQAPDGYEVRELLSPIGLLIVNTQNGSAWFGVPQT
jgi:hypothetical protein